MALNANTMAASIVAAVKEKTSDPIFQAKCGAGIDITQEIWEVICQKLIEHIKSNMTITIPALTVNSGIPISQNSTSATGTTQPKTLGAGQIK